jgi:hypothetical protein
MPQTWSGLRRMPLAEGEAEGGLRTVRCGGNTQGFTQTVLQQRCWLDDATRLRENAYKMRPILSPIGPSTRLL